MHIQHPCTRQRETDIATDIQHSTWRNDADNNPTIGNFITLDKGCYDVHRCYETSECFGRNQFCSFFTGLNCKPNC